MVLSAVLALVTGCGPAAPTVSAAGRADSAVTTVLADLEDFWSAAQPALGGPPFVAPSGGYHAIDSSSPGPGALCVSRPSRITGNAFYCPDEDGLVWDSAALVPVLYGRGGTGAVAAVFAHEYGHVIQARIGPTPAQRSADPVTYPTLLAETQADCYAGAFLAWVRDGRSTREQLTSDDLLPAVQLLLDFRDPPGMVATDPAAHGRGVDRAAFLLRGLRDGATACRALTTADLPLDRRTDNDSQPRFADRSAVLADAAPSVATVVARGTSATVAVTPAPDPADLDAAAPYGQFAEATAAALAAGRDATGTATGAACLAGVWTAAVTASPTGGGLGARAVDPDEALDLVRYRPGATFDQLAAFVDGWTGGRAGCR